MFFCDDEQTAPAIGLNLPHTSRTADQLLQSFFISDTLRDELLARVNAIYQTIDPNGASFDSFLFRVCRL